MSRRSTASEMREEHGALIGRDAEIGAVEELLARGTRLVTLTGAAGIGKTALARAVAGRLRVRGGRAVVCEIGERRDVDGLCAAVAHALELGPQGGGGADDAAASFAGALAAFEGLLVLDGFEQLGAPGAALLADWLAAAPRLALLVASRHRLGVEDEHVVELRPLGLPRSGEPVTASPAVELLLRRARRVRHDYAPSADEEPLLAEIVRELDGLPLALELAAARLIVMGVATLRERLRARLELLRTGAHDRPGRSMRSALDLSWQLLEPFEQSALAQCSVFAGGLTLAAAEAVIDLGAHALAPPVVDVLAALRSRSLLYAYEHDDGPPGELRLGLYLVVREYAALELERAGGLVAAHARHRAHYAALAASLAPAIERGSGEARAALRVELDNVTAAIDRVLADPRAGTDAVREAASALSALDTALRTRLPLAAHLARLDGVCRSARELDPRQRARLLQARARVHRRAGRTGAAIADLDQALAIATGLGDRGLEGELWQQLGASRLARSEVDGAEDAYERALAALSEAGHARAQGLTLASLADLRIDRGDGEAALPLLERALDRVRRAGGPRDEAIVLYTTAMAHRDRGARSDAVRLYEEARRAFAALGDRWFESACLLALALADHEEGRVAEAAARSERAYALAAGIDVRLEALALAHRGALAHEDGAGARDADAAARLLLGVEAGSYAITVDLMRGLGEVARGERALETDPALAQACFAAARGRLAASADTAPRSLDVRLARSLLADALARVGAAAETGIEVAADGSWFRLAGAERVDLSHRRSLRLILARLTEARLLSPGAPLGLDAIVAAGWPRERIQPEAAANRAYSAIRHLRERGLRRALVRRDDGYLLCPSIVVRRVGVERSGR